MCYSVESSARTALLALIAIVILLKSNVPHFQWFGIVLIGWSLMQFDEFLLWLTNPRKSCTTANKIITVTLIPFTLCLNTLCPVLGSFFVKSWSECSPNRKLFILFYSLASTITLLIYFYGNPIKYCTTVTAQGHLDWWVSIYDDGNRTMSQTIWLIIITIPFVLWDMSYKAVFAICILPLLGHFYGITTDSSGSIWCHYASFTSITSLLMYGLYKYNIYNILQ